MQAKDTLPLLKAAFDDWLEDKASRLAAALAYYTALSIAPMIVLGVLLLKPLPWNGEEVVKGQMTQLMGEQGGKTAEMMIQSANKSSGWLAGTISVLVLLWGASNVFAELQDSMNTVWEVQPKPGLSWWDTIKKRFLSMAMVLGIGFLLLVSLFASTVLTAVAHRIAGEGRVVGFVLDVVLTLLVTIVFFGAIFKVLPDVKLAWRDVIHGAVLTAVLFTIGKYLLSWYLSRGSTTSAYGAAGSFAALLIWVYYSAQIMFFGAEFTQAYAEKFGSRIVLEKDAIPVTAEQRAQQGLVPAEKREQTAAALADFADHKGAPFPRPTVPDRRVVTITRPTPASAKANVVAGMGLTAGFVVGAIGMLAGRKYTGMGLQEIRLQQRLNRLESVLGSGKQMQRRAMEINLARRLDEMEARFRNARDSVRLQQDHRPGWVKRASEAVRTGNWTPPPKQRSAWSRVAESVSDTLHQHEDHRPEWAKRLAEFVRP